MRRLLFTLFIVSTFVFGAFVSSCGGGGGGGGGTGGGNVVSDGGSSGGSGGGSGGGTGGGGTGGGGTGGDGSGGTGGGTGGGGGGGTGGGTGSDGSGGGSGGGNGGGGGGGTGGGFTISGKIENWQQGYTIKAYIDGNGEHHYGNILVNNDGTFTYTLPIPNPSHLKAITFEGDGECQITQQPTVSPNNSKLAAFKLKVSIPNIGEREVELVYDGQPPLPSNTPISGIYIYVDQNTTINGVLIENCPDESTKRMQFDNLNVNAGWNYVEIIFVSYDQQNNTIDFKIVKKSSPSSVLKWVIIGGS